MNLAPNLHALMTGWFSTRPVMFPARFNRPFPDGYEHIYRKCYRIMAGVNLLEKHGKLLPWPHMINAIGANLSDGLVDASRPPVERSLGFIPIKKTETVHWNEISAAYAGNEQDGSTSWGCELADDLSRRFLDRFRQQAEVAAWSVIEISVPSTIPEVD